MWVLFNMSKIKEEDSIYLIELTIKNNHHHK